MKVGIIGSGGREHAICHKLCTIKKSNKYIVFLEMLVLLKLLKIFQ